MGNLLTGLEGLGLGELKDMEVYEDTKVAEKAAGREQKKEKTEVDFLFVKMYPCPVCSYEIRVPAVRTGKAKLIGQDRDLRPHYEGIDPLKYDAISCPECGYSALTRFFSTITAKQKELIREKISPKFQTLPLPDGCFDYDDAVIRHRLALACAMVKHSKVSERAYICLKTAWLLRGKGEHVDTVKEKKAVEAEEIEFLETAFEGFEEAVSKESFPICGMDETTLYCMLAEIGHRVGKYEEAARLVSRVITSHANERIKNRAREIKDAILADMKTAGKENDLEE